MQKKNKVVPVRGFLLHISHYDPKWCRVKSKEKCFDLETGLEIVDALAEAGMNMLIIDCSDGVTYRSHPEFKRRYSVPMSHLKELVDYANKKHIEVVPKLNFSQSHYYKHNHWMRPHNRLFDNEKYWDIGFEVIDELIDVCRPKRFFHVGMDEDHERAHTQYVAAIKMLHTGLKKRGLRTVIWNDSTRILRKATVVHGEKSIAAENKIPKDIVQIPWEYYGVFPDIIKRIVNKGFETWIASSNNIEQVQEWKGIIKKYGGNGMIMTRWIHCDKSNRPELLSLIRNVGPHFL